MFRRTWAIQIRSDFDLALAFGEMPNAFEVTLVPAWQRIEPGLFKAYLRHEFVLVLAQGCKYACKFCAARKGQAEVFRSLEHFKTDLKWLLSKANGFGLKKLEAYATSLDFFQSPEKLPVYLEALADAQTSTGVSIKVRCLSTMRSFLTAVAGIPNLATLLQRAGVWCVGFGVDGADTKIWQAQRKGFNRLSEIDECLKLCQAFGIRPELLLVLGFPEDNLRTLAKAVFLAFRYVVRWPNVMVRPYLAKKEVPGNDGWPTSDTAEQCAADPKLFFNLDFCSVGSKLTHPRRWHRYFSNLAYLAITALWFTKRCATAPLLPQGSGVFGLIARAVNRRMPFDR